MDTALASQIDSTSVAPLVGQSLADNLVAYMHRLEHRPGIPIDSLRERLSLHAQMLDQLLAQYEREMQILDVRGGNAWKATVDSLRGDLSTLRSVSDEELRPALAEHQRRVDKLIQFHEAMVRTGGIGIKPPAGAMPAERYHPDRKQ